MDNLLPNTLYFYLFPAVLAILFLLQLWAILRIKDMLLQVTEIFKFVKAGSLPIRAASHRKAFFKQSCEFCKHRTTYLSDKKQFQFIHFCKKKNIMIELNKSCNHFILDPHLSEK